jgi:hypothetical protein
MEDGSLKLASGDAQSNPIQSNAILVHSLILMENNILGERKTRG